MELIERRFYFLQLISEHILISFGALLFTAILGTLLGILVFYSSKSKTFILPIINLLYTIPSIAMFGLLIPIVGIGLNNALIVLILYGLLPIVRNTYTGLKEVPISLIEAAKGMGATPFQIFKDVYFPLALPLILSGIRITTVMLVALTGLAALIGAGGLGQAIFRGLNTMNTQLIVVGSIFISIFAILGDRFIGSFENKLVSIISNNATRSQKIRVVSNIVVLIIIVISAFVHLKSLPNAQNQNSITVAAKPTGEQFILGEIISQLIEQETDLHVVRKFGIGGGTTNIHPAMLNGEVDLYVEYTGTGWMNVLKMKLPQNNKLKLDKINQLYLEKFNLRWIGLLGFNNTYAMAIPDSLASKYNIKTCSDLVKYSQHFTFGAEFDFFERPDGYQGLVDKYNFNFFSIKEMDINLRYNAIIEGKINAINAFTTDAKIAAINLRVLKDDKNYFPSYEAGIVIRKSVLSKYPQLEAVLTKLNGKISTQTMMQLNHKVEVENKDPKEVAKEFIKTLTETSLL